MHPPSCCVSFLMMFGVVGVCVEWYLGTLLSILFKLGICAIDASILELCSLLLPLLRGAGPMALMLWLDGMMMMMTAVDICMCGPCMCGPNNCCNCTVDAKHALPSRQGLLLGNMAGLQVSQPELTGCGSTHEREIQSRYTLCKLLV
jgi:hypothetical protein